MPRALSALHSDSDSAPQTSLVRFFSGFCAHLLATRYSSLDRALLLRLHKLKPELEDKRAQEEQDLRAKLEAEMEAAWQQIDFMRKRLEVSHSFHILEPCTRTVLLRTALTSTSS